MDVFVFILLAYLATAAMLGALCVATWMRARAVKRQLRQYPDA